LIKNNKFYLCPPKDGSDLKELFKKLTASGAGQQLTGDGFPPGPWTPELLAEAISKINSNRNGVDLRTVQLWFQDNDKGISTANIRWLARIFGCDDPVATSEWQVELRAAQDLFTVKRKETKKVSPIASKNGEFGRQVVGSRVDQPLLLAAGMNASRLDLRFGLAIRSEALFSSGSPLNLPASVFAGAAALGFLSYILGVHNATFVRPDGVAKQVGFIWAPNWTVLFTVVQPLFFACVIELLAFWKHEGRSKFVEKPTRVELGGSWAQNLEASSYTYWAAFLICVLFAGLFQWIAVCLVPLINGPGSYAIDWGKIAIVRPEIVSVPATILFTGVAYLYMSICFYLFFVGLILLYMVVQDVWKLEKLVIDREDLNLQEETKLAVNKILRAIFRCTILGVYVAICMKIQSSYLTSFSSNIVSWLADDVLALVNEGGGGRTWHGYRMPTHYSSLLITISTCVIFFLAHLRLGRINRSRYLSLKPSAVVGLLVTGYLLIGAFDGFSILLGIGAIVGLYGLFDPEFRRNESAN
jgi:hypothetical protein